MMQLVLALVLSAQAILGPNLCCCSFFTPAPATVADATAAKQAPTACHCCTQPVKPAPKEKQTPRDSCPCPQDHAQNVAIHSPSGGAEHTALRPVNDFSVGTSYHISDHSRVLLAVALQVPAFNPFLTTQDLLDAHHVMRC